jgi:hypothetical protein
VFLNWKGREKIKMNPLLIITIITIISVIIFIILLLISPGNPQNACSLAFSLKSGNKKVFSFCLYGTARKYSQGMIRNLELIQQRFPEWEVWIYVASDVPSEEVYI